MSESSKAPWLERGKWVIVTARHLDRSVLRYGRVLSVDDLGVALLVIGDPSRALNTPVLEVFIPWSMVIEACDWAINQREPIVNVSFGRWILPEEVRAGFVYNYHRAAFEPPPATPAKAEAEESAPNE